VDLAAFSRLIDEHLARRPLMAPADVYKLLYQGVLGPEHLITSSDDFAARLRAEYEAVEPDDSDPLWERVRPDGALKRVNLRPFKARGGDVESLTGAGLQTAERHWGTPAELRAAWAGFVELCRAFDPAEVLALTARLEELGYPPVHHSPGYREAYRPAYRVCEWTNDEGGT